MFQLTTTDISHNLLKAVIYDIVATVVANYIYNIRLNPEELFDALATAFTSFTIRGIAREDFNHPWIGGVIGGAIKYTAKNSSAIAGSLNNFAYEFFNDVPAGLGGAEAGLIEGAEAAGLKLYAILSGKSEIPQDKFFFEPIILEFAAAGEIALIVVGFDFIFHAPFAKYIDSCQLPVIPLLSTYSILTAYTLSAAYNNIAAALPNSHSNNSTLAINDASFTLDDFEVLRHDTCITYYELL